MSSLECLLQRVNEECQAHVDKCIQKNNVVYSWLEEFAQDAKQQILSINREAWIEVPKTPGTKRKSRSRKSKQSTSQTSRQDDQIPSTSRINTYSSVVEEISLSRSNTSNDQNCMPPPRRMPSRRVSKRVADSVQATRSSKRSAAPKEKLGKSVQKKRKESPNKKSVSSQGDSGTTDDDSVLPTVPGATISEVKEQHEQNQSIKRSPSSTLEPPIVVDKKTMPPPVNRPSRRNTSLQKSCTSPKPVKRTMSARDNSENDKRRQSNSSFHLQLDSGSTDNDSESDIASNIGEPTVGSNKITSHKPITVLSNSNKANETRKTEVVKSFGERKLPLPIIDAIQIENIKKECPTPKTALMNISVVILDSESEVDTPPPKQNCVLSKQQTEKTMVRNTNLVLTNRIQQNETPQVLTSLHDVKRSLHKNFLANSKTPQSPKQLFSAYTKGGIKGRTQAFENLNAGNNNESVASANEGTPLRGNVRRSVRRSIMNGDSLVLAKAARVSATTRRSMLMRHRLSVTINKCARKLSANKENLKEMNEQVVDPASTDDDEKKDATFQMHLEEPVEEHLELVETQSSAKECNSQNLEEEEPVSEKQSEDEEVPLLEKCCTYINASAVKSTSTSRLRLGTTSAATSATKNTLKKCGSGNTLSKAPSGGVLSNRPQPVSETRAFQKSRVAEMVSMFDKGPSFKSNSCSKAQGHLSRLGSNQMAIYSSVATGFKAFQKPSYAMSVREAKQSLLAEEIEKKRAKEEEILKKRKKMLKERTEDIRRKNEEKQQRVREKRIKEKQATENLRRTLEKQDQDHQLTKKAVEERKRSQIEAKKIQRLKRETEKRKQEEEALAAARLRAQEEQKERIEELKRQQQLKKEAEAREAMMKMKTAPVPKAIQKVTLNQTYTADQSSDGNNYDITPHRSELPKEELKDTNNYDIEDLKSDDETDDECDPKKKIPDWAQGVSLRIAVISQHRNPLNPDNIFPPIETCQLEKLFKVQRSRFYQRTSSAVWHDPPTLL